MFAKRRRIRGGRLVKRRAQAFLLRTIGALLLVLAVLSVASFLFSRDSVRIHTVFIEGNSAVAASELQAFTDDILRGSYFFIFPRESVFLYPRSGITGGVLGAFPKVKSADVHFEDFQSITLIVSERNPFALWCLPAAEAGGDESAPACYFLDETGFIYTPAPDFSGSAYFRYYGGISATEDPFDPTGTRFLEEDEFRNLSFFERALREELGLPVSSLTILDEHDLELTLSGGARLIVSRTDDLSVILGSIEAAFRSPELAGDIDSLDYADFRFGNKVYYAWK